VGDAVVEIARVTAKSKAAALNIVKSAGEKKVANQEQNVACVNCAFIDIVAFASTCDVPTGEGSRSPAFSGEEAHS
jgi:hypothetical protein